MRCVQLYSNLKENQYVSVYSADIVATNSSMYVRNWNNEIGVGKRKGCMDQKMSEKFPWFLNCFNLLKLT